MLKAVVEPKNKEDKLVVAIIKDDCLVGHLPKKKTGSFAKIVFYFPRACCTNTCSLKSTGTAINQEDGKAMKMPCKLYFSAEDSFINILKQQILKAL